MTIKQASPLPECEMCGTPTVRDKHTENGGLCSKCLRGIADTVRMLPVGGGVVDLSRERARRRLLAPPDVTVFVERYTPPVPGQLTIDPEDDR